MHDFHGTVHIADEPESLLDAKVTVDLNKVSIRAGDVEIGTWPQSAVDVRRSGDAVLLHADGDTLVLKLENANFFLDLVGPDEETPQSRRRRSRRKSRRSEPNEYSPPVFDQTSASGEDPDRLNRLRTGAAADYAVDQSLPGHLAIGLVVAIALILTGAALTWGSARLFDPGSFPIARAVAGFAGLAALLGLYFGYFDERRFIGAAVAVATGGVLFGVVFLYLRAAHLGMGFVLTMLGSIGLIAFGAVAIAGSGARSNGE